MGASSLTGTPCCLDQFQDLAPRRVPAEGLLREQSFAIQAHFEHAARTWLQRDLGSRNGLLDLSRQTGGSQFVVSNDAVLDADVHAIPVRRER
jgi:hypothetical protein